MKEKTMVFFVVDSQKDNEEIFTTEEEALKAFKLIKKVLKPRLYIAKVKHAYLEDIYPNTIFKVISRIERGEFVWNYDDFSDTFEIVKIIK